MKYYICLCQGISKDLKNPSKQTLAIFMEMTKHLDTYSPIIFSGGYRVNDVSEAQVMRNQLMDRFAKHQIIYEDKSSMGKGGNISNLMELEKIFKKSPADQLLIFTSKLTKFRTEIVAKKIFTDTPFKVFGVDVPFGNNIQTRYSNRLFFTIWNWMLNLATIVLLPTIKAKWKKQQKRPHYFVAFFYYIINFA